MSFERYTIAADPRDDWEIVVMKGGFISVQETGSVGGIVLESQSEYEAFLRALRRAARKLEWEK